MAVLVTARRSGAVHAAGVARAQETSLGDLADYQPGERSTAHVDAALADPARFAEVEQGLTLLGLVGIKDPARPEVPAAIDRCTEAGVRVIMITGDSKPTAAAIAKDVRIFGPAEETEGRTFAGGEFFELPLAQQEGSRRDRPRS